MEVFQILVKARTLIEQPENWCRGYSGPSGQRCAVHALQTARAALNINIRFEVEAYRSLGRAMGVDNPDSGSAMGLWNDTHTHEDVLAAYDRAIKSAEPVAA